MRVEQLRSATGPSERVGKIDDLAKLAEAAQRLGRSLTEGIAGEAVPGVAGGGTSRDPTTSRAQKTLAGPEAAVVSVD
jgi:hypothetical protein